MKHLSLSSLAALLEEIGHALIALTRQTLHALAAMSWPMLLLSCVGLALALTILPLALVLFLVFTAIKLIVAAIVVHNRRRIK